MTDRVTLGSLSLGEEMSVLSVGGDASMQQRLEDLGVVSGTNISCVMISPMGDPRAYLIRGAVIALRHEDADRIQGELIMPSECGAAEAFDNGTDG